MNYYIICGPFGVGLRDNARCSSRTHWKARSGLLLVLIELFH